MDIVSSDAKDKLIQTNKNNYIYNKNEFLDRSFEEVENGFYDENGFYNTPDGSFWNLEGDYFNKYGYDKYGGFYNEEKVYIPGEGWNEELQMYNEDLIDKLPLDEDKLLDINNEFGYQIMIHDDSFEEIGDDLDENLYNSNKKSGHKNAPVDFLQVDRLIEEEKLKTSAQKSHASDFKNSNLEHSNFKHSYASAVKDNPVNNIHAFSASKNNNENNLMNTNPEDDVQSNHNETFKNTEADHSHQSPYVHNPTPFKKDH